MAFAMYLQDSLIKDFDQPPFMESSLLIAELFMNLSAVNPRFVTHFLKHHSYEKVIHVHDMWNDREPILFVLADNIFSRGGADPIPEGFDFPIYLYKQSRALQTGDSPILYFSPLVYWDCSGRVHVNHQETPLSFCLRTDAAWRVDNPGGWKPRRYCPLTLQALHGKTNKERCKECMGPVPRVSTATDCNQGSKGRITGSM
jgi:hypothetical protein